MSNYMTNCPNCGAPIKSYGYCPYCGTRFEQQVQAIYIRPGVRKLECRAQFPLALGEKNPEAMTRYAIDHVTSEMAQSLTEAIKFTVQRDFDPRRFEEIINVRGELWIQDPVV